MSDVSTEPESKESSASTDNSSSGQINANDLSKGFSDFMSTVNETLGKVDWSQMGKYGKAAGIIAVVIVAQVIIKAIIDTVNFLPIVPGLLELLGIVIVGQWSWQNLTTSEKRNDVIEKIQNLRQKYLG